MHFEILVEDASGKIALGHIVPRILGKNTEHSFRIHAYKGIGRLPNNLKPNTEPCKRILLDQLPRILRGYGKSLMPREQHAVIVVVDLDSKDCQAFKKDLLDLATKCNPTPRILFRIAIEEMEACLLGDRQAIKAAYPQARMLPLNHYVQDSICGTWEVLADALYQGGSSTLKKLGFPQTGQAKCGWAEHIAPHLDIEANESPSFQVFRQSFNKLDES